MARTDSKREVQDAAAVLARFVVGVVWDHLNTVIIDQPPQQTGKTPVKAVGRNEAAEMLDLSVKSVDRLVEQKIFKPLPKTGRAVRIPVQQIEDYLRQRE
jgi:hypothetical protein